MENIYLKMRNKDAYISVTNRHKVTMSINESTKRSSITTGPGVKLNYIEQELYTEPITAREFHEAYLKAKTLLDDIVSAE